MSVSHTYKSFQDEKGMGRGVEVQLELETIDWNRRGSQKEKK